MFETNIHKATELVEEGFSFDGQGMKRISLNYGLSPRRRPGDVMPQKEAFDVYKDIKRHMYGQHVCSHIFGRKTLKQDPVQ